MAWNVVIVGGGFGGASAARRLERLIPRQAARLVLVNDVNFLLYTPFLPEAAAGTLEPRHVVTPLRDMLKRTYLRLGAVTGHDPAARTLQLTSHEDEVDELRYDQLLLALGSVSRLLPVPGLEQTGIGFKSLADAIWLRNHIVETLEAANASEDPERREELLTYVFVGAGYAGLEALAELQDFAADAMERYPRARLHGMRWIGVEATDRVLPEIDANLANYAMRELRARGIEIRLGTRLEEATPTGVRLSTGEWIPTRTLVWTTGVAPHPSLASLSVPLDERGRVPVDRYLRVSGMDGVWALGDCAAVPDPSDARRRSLAPDGAARDPPGAGRGPQHRRRAGNRHRPAVPLPGPGGVRQPRPPQGRRAAGPVQVPRLSRVVDGPHLPREQDPGPRPQDPYGRRLDSRPAVRSRHRRGGLDRPPAAAEGLRIRPRRHASPAQPITMKACSSRS